jgi:hypothetical protein
MSLESEILEAFEEHSSDGIRRALAAGASATTPIKGKAPIDCLIEGYLRSARFADCLGVLLQAGATLDPLLQALLLDDDRELRRLMSSPGQSVERKLHLHCAFTSCEGVAPLHVCAEFNSVRCARALLDLGANVDALAETDTEGFGGQTPIYHAVNSIFNYCRPMMELLVEAGAELEVMLKGIVWGSGQPWETLVLDVTPLSYTQCGLYAQFHRTERDIYDNLQYLYRHRHGKDLRLHNVPNKYLAPKA